MIFYFCQPWAKRRASRARNLCGGSLHGKKLYQRDWLTMIDLIDWFLPGVTKSPPGLGTPILLFRGYFRTIWIFKMFFNVRKKKKFFNKILIHFFKINGFFWSYLVFWNELIWRKKLYFFKIFFFLLKKPEHLSK
jgi:hypothetical protein